MAEVAVATPAMAQRGDALGALAYSMIMGVISGGGRAPQILVFQQYINSNLALLNADLKYLRPDIVAKGVRYEKLVADGAWGRYTGATLYLVLVLTSPSVDVSIPPLRSVGVAEWYAQNSVGIDALVAPLSDAGEVELQQAQAAASISSAPVPPAEELPPEIQEQLNGSGAGAITSSVIDPGPPAPVIMDFDVADSPQTYGTSRKGGVPWVAVGGAAVVLVGALWWMGRKK